MTGDLIILFANYSPRRYEDSRRATALSLPDNHAEIVGRKETRPTCLIHHEDTKKKQEKTSCPSW
jgi:hypothetical protein